MSGNLLGRLKVNYAQEWAKWELCELIFLVGFISAYSQECKFFDLALYGESLPVVLQISFRILLRTVEKMKIPDSVEIESPSKIIKVKPQFSSGKRRRQEELVKELQEQRVLISEYKLRLTEKENELLNIKNSYVYVDNKENNDVKLYQKIHYLEKLVYKLQENIDDKATDAIKMKKKIDKMQDELDIAANTIQELERQVSKLQDQNKKFDNFLLVEKKLKDYERMLKQSYQDKDLLLMEAQNLRRNSKNIKIVEKQVSDLLSENYELACELKNLKSKYKVLESEKNDHLEIIKNIPAMQEDYLRQKISSSYASSQISECDQKPLLVEEFEVKIDSLQEENKRLTNELIYKENQVELCKNLKTLGTDSEAHLLKYSKLECDFYETKLNLNKRIESLEQQLFDSQNLLAEARHEREMYLNQSNDFKNKMDSCQKLFTDSSSLVEKLRGENFKLRDNIAKLKSSNELESLKNENSRLEKEIFKIKAELHESVQNNYSLKAENRHLYGVVEEFKKESECVELSKSEMVAEGNIQMSEIVSNIQIRMIESILDKENVKAEVAETILKLRKMNEIVSPQSQFIIDKLIGEKNELILKTQDEIRKKFEAERRSLALLKKLREYEELQ